MRIEPIELPPPEKRWKEKRCSRIVRSTGTTYFQGRRNQCGRMARYKLDGVMFCVQHAGEMALKQLINQQEKHDGKSTQKD